MIQKKKSNKIINFIKKNLNIIKLAGIVLVSLIVLKYAILLFTPKPQIPDEVKAQLGELNKVTTQLQLSQKKYDNLLVEQSRITAELDAKIGSIKEKVTIIREYYHEKSTAADKYTPTQVDSFLKNRYNY